MSDDPIVNREDPIPVLTISGDENDHQEDPSKPKDRGQDGKPRKRASSTKLKEHLTRAIDPVKAGGSVQDRLFSTLFKQILPDAQHAYDEDDPDRRSRKYVDRPGFSLPLMSNNFRRFNARVGVVFVFQNRLIRLFTWRVVTQTLSFLSVYTLCCLNPSLLAVIPLAACLFFVMVPAFLSRHPPPPNSHPADNATMQGPASAPAPNIKPAPEMSKDFFRNMRDLQNSMEDFSIIHDRLIALVAPITNFSNESVSSAVFLCLFLIACLLFIVSTAIPWRFSFLTVGWVAVCSMHPAASKLYHILTRDQAVSRGTEISAEVWEWMRDDITLDEDPETREVEMFELQRHQDGVEWHPWIYTSSPFDPLSPTRISGGRPRGTRFFEDVKPPAGWEWKDKKWSLDLLSRHWVEERMITAVEVETEGERWVYDIGASDFPTDRTSHRRTGSDWEEGTGIGPKGEWRRRRWIRLVQRQASR